MKHTAVLLLGFVLLAKNVWVNASSLYKRPMILLWDDGQPLEFW
jgi:hypothetical protein